MKRRDVLKTMGAVAGAAGIARLLPGCGGDDDGEPPGPTGITTVVLLMMENRSYDHWLGARSMLESKPGDGLTAEMANLDLEGASVPIWEATPSTLCVPDPPHGWDAGREQLAEGANTGFLTAHQRSAPNDISVMQYMTREQLPVTWALADEYATCDRWFASVLGPTWPNRMYWLAGTSMGMTSNEVPAGGFTTPLIFNRLDEAGVPWKLYYGDLPFLTLLDGVELEVTGKVKRMQDFYRDCREGTLPPVAYLDPPWAYGDDHPPHHPIYGQQLLASVYAALAESPQWNNILFVVSFDECGGFYDHVAPPAGAADEHAAEGFDQLGFRVPTLVIGPYVKKGHVSTVQRDHTSALKHLETMFGTAPLSARTTAATDLSELIDQDRLTNNEPSAPITLPMVSVDDAMIDGKCMGSSLMKHDILEAFDARPEVRAEWDARDELPALGRAMNEVLARHYARGS